MVDFNLMGSLIRDLHQEFVKIYYLMLPVFFCLSIAVTWIKSPQGSIDFIDVLKRAIVATLLLAAFPEIAQTIIAIADGIAQRIDDKSNLDAVIRMAQEKAEDYSFSAKSLLIGFNDLMIALMVFLSFVILYVARYITIAMYHFYWVFYMVSAPLLLLFNLFPATGNIPANLFKGMIEVASWKIVWSILGAMLLSLSFGEAYKTEGSYLVIVVMNFVIAIAMLATPLLVKSLVNQGATAMSSGLGQASVQAMAAVPTKGMSLARAGQTAVSSTRGYVNNRLKNFTNEKNKRQNINRGT